LKIEKEFREDHQVKLTVVLDPEPFEVAKHRAARDIAKRVKIPGFRPGKAPYGVVLRQVGEANIVEKALDYLIEDQYPEIIKEAGIDPYGPGKLENISELDPPTFEFVVPLQAEVVLGDHKSIRIPYELPEITDIDVDNSLEQIRQQHATRENADRPAELGDVVFMRVTGKRMDKDDEAESIFIPERFSSSVIQEDENENEWPFSGFAKELIGLSGKEEKNIRYKFPEDYHDEALQGVDAEFSAVVTNIQSQTLPELNDEFTKATSEFETLDEWKANLRENLEEQSKVSYAEKFDDQILDQIISLSTLKYPPQMVEQEKADIRRGLEYRLSQQGITKELYLQIRGIDEEALDVEITPIADERVKRALILMEIAGAENIKADPEKIQAEMGRTVQAISRSMNPTEAKKFAKSEYIPSLASNIAVDMLTQTTMEFLRATAKGETWVQESVEQEIVSDEVEKIAEEASIFDSPSEDDEIQSVENEKSEDGNSHPEIEQEITD